MHAAGWRILPKSQEGNPAERSEREAPGYPFTGRGHPKDP